MPSSKDIQSTILTTANAGYPDNLVPLTYEAAIEALSDPQKGPGDTLAVFIAVECCEVIESATSLDEAAGAAALAMERSADELLMVAKALRKLEN